MIKKNIGRLILSSLIILLPGLIALLFWNRLPEQLPSHWGIHGQVDGWSGRGFLVVLPLILLTSHWLCILITALDPRNKDQHPKAFRLVIWILPCMSIMFMGFYFFLLRGESFSALRLLHLVFCLLLLVFGNYMPKIRRNSTIGIKIHWTLQSEENWNATHRFAGKVWTVCGIGMLPCVYLPDEYLMIPMLVVILAVAALPMVYSWRFHKKEVEQGTLPEQEEAPSQRKASLWITGVFSVALVIFLAVVMFTGSIRAQAGEEALIIEASFRYGLELPYEQIDSIQLRQEQVSGTRVNGFGSAKLLMGTFQNEEFGLYTRYTYTDTDCAIVIDAGGKMLVLGLEDEDATRALYDALEAKVG